MKPLRFRPPGADYEFHVVGHRPQPLRDFYHALLNVRWSIALAIFAGVFLVANLIFAAVFLAIGGVVGVHGFWDAFFFSVQTMGTIGYGAMYPGTRVANALVVVEAITGLTFTALATGLVFAKFSRANARMVFTRQAVITLNDGVPTLMFRLGNERSNQIVDAQVRVTCGKTEKTREGRTMYRTYDVPLARERMLSLQRSWTILHVIDEKSPLFRATPESVLADEVELHVMVIGVDDVTVQQVHASHRYYASDLLFGRRHVDILSVQSPEVLVLDLTRFHDTEPTQPTPEFPYPTGEVGERPPEAGG